MRRKFWANPATSAWVLAVILGATALRLWELGQTPPGFHFDESFEGLEAWRIFTEPDYRPIFLRGNFGVPVGFAYLTAGMYWVFVQFGAEAGPLAMRATAALLGIATVPVVIGATRELVLWGLLPSRAAWPVALSAGAVCAGLRWHVHFSRMGIEPILGPLLWAAAVWLLLYGWRMHGERPVHSRVALVVCGLVAAGAMYSYQAIWILPLLMAGWAGILFMARNQPVGAGTAPVASGVPWVGLLVAMVAASLLVLPLMLLFAQEPGLMTTRPTQVIGGEGNDRTFLKNSVATLGMFVPFGEGDLDPRRNIPGKAALNWIWGSAFWIGAVAGLRRIRSVAWQIVWLSWAGLLLPGVVTEYAPHFHRILAAAGPSAVIVAVGLWYAGRAAHRGLEFIVHYPLPQRMAGGVIVGLVVAASVWDAHGYFVRWAPRADLYYAFDEGLWEIARWRAPMVDGVQPHYFISPRGLAHPTLAFGWREVAESDRPVQYDGRHVFPLVERSDAKASVYIVIEHEDFRTPLLLPEAFPEAQILHVFRDREGQTYATAYLRPATATLARFPTAERAIDLNPSIRLLGYDLLPEVPEPGGIAYIQLHWQARAQPTQDWTVFLHLVDPATQERVAGHDARPGQGALATDRWQTGWRILDEHQILLPQDLAPGEYRLVLGLYPSGQPDAPLGEPVDVGIVAIGEPGQ